MQSFHQKGGEGWQEFQKGATFILQGWVKCCTLKKSKLSVDGLTQFWNFRSDLWTLTWQNMLVQDHQLKDIFCRFEIFLKLRLPNLFQSYLSEIRMKTIVLFQAYDTSHRLDNSLLQITLNITLRSQNNKEQKYNNEAAPYLLTN